MTAELRTGVHIREQAYKGAVLETELEDTTEVHVTIRAVLTVLGNTLYAVGIHDMVWQSAVGQ